MTLPTSSYFLTCYPDDVEQLEWHKSQLQRPQLMMYAVMHAGLQFCDFAVLGKICFAGQNKSDKDMFLWHVLFVSRI